LQTPSESSERSPRRRTPPPDLTALAFESGDLEAFLHNPFLAAAVENARWGFPVYPARPRGKNPLWKGWQRGATTKAHHLAGIWERHPRANVGVLLRGLTVLDADSRRGEDALEELGLPPTTAVRTRRGVHLYFLGGMTGGSTVLPDVELRGKGQGVLGAGSIHPSGHEYAWEVAPWEVSPVPLPAEVRAIARPAVEVLPGGIGPVFPGGRSVHLLRVAGMLRARAGLDTVSPVLHAVNEAQCEPPLPAAKVEALARQGEKLAVKPWLVDPIGFCNTDERLSRDARLVLHLLCYHADHHGECFPGVRRLAELGAIRGETVGKATRELEAYGRIDVRRSRRGNRYRLLRWESRGASVTPLDPPKGLTSVPPAGTPGMLEQLRRAA
jgi:Bifunctional DNA primase/polymerase, N-terminal/Helix-turn-helix domain